MKKHLILAVAAVACLVPAAAHAQATTGQSFERVPAQAPPVGVKTVMGAVETRITPDRPYSAEAVNETEQVLADGNRIHRRSVTKVYRDGAGRTRRETLADDGTVRSISISDPVARTSYTLDPQTKVARKGGSIAVVAPTMRDFVVINPTGVPPASTTTAAGARAGGGGGSGSSAATGVARGGYAEITSGGGGRGGVRAKVADNANRETLDPQNIEGVIANGTRTTTTIPAGQIGNAQEIKIISEQWFSDELQLIVLTKHSDPRSGETTYRLTNILRAEPDPSLFTVPADYTVEERRR
jgi:YD repeat-containing protein